MYFFLLVWEIVVISLKMDVAGTRHLTNQLPLDFRWKSNHPWSHSRSEGEKSILYIGPDPSVGLIVCDSIESEDLAHNLILKVAMTSAGDHTLFLDTHGCPGCQ